MSISDKTKIYFFDREGGDVSPIFVNGAGVEICPQNYRVRRINSTISVLIYVCGGSGSISIDGKTFTANKGDAFLLPKNTAHDYYTNSSKHWTILWFNIEGDLVNQMVALYGLEIGKAIHFENSHIEDLFTNGIELARNGKGTNSLQMKLSLIIMEILIRLSDVYKNQAESDLGESEDKGFAKIKNFIDENIFQSISMEMLESRFHLSQRQINRIFKKRIGVSPYEYYSSQKANLACKYLENTSMSIKEISNKLGFCDPYYFSNFFKKRVGTSPKLYRYSK